jgi:hypothetical protein
VIGQACRSAGTAKTPYRLTSRRKRELVAAAAAQRSARSAPSAESGTAWAAARNPIFEWVPSQKGFFVEAPQRQSMVLGIRWVSYLSRIRVLPQIAWIAT